MCIGISGIGDWFFLCLQYYFVFYRQCFVYTNKNLKPPPWYKVNGIFDMNDLFLVVYDYPWSIDGTDVWLTKPYKLSASLKDAKKDARFYKRVHPSYDLRVLPVDSTGRFGDPVFKL